MEHKEHDHDCSCCANLPNPSVQQNLDELDFERSIWQAAIDNDVRKIEKFAGSASFNPDAVDKYGYVQLRNF